MKTEGGAPTTTLGTSKAEIIDMMIQSGDITADELAEIANGATVDIVLTVKDGSAAVSADSKAQMENGAGDYTVGQYLDISLFKYMTVNGKTDDGQQIHETAGMVTISVQVPENLINTDGTVNRTYCIIRNHNGEVSILEASYDAARYTLTFQTNRFSDYAIGYKDTKIKDNDDPKKDDPKQDDNNGTGDNGNSGTGNIENGTSASTGKTSPQTGDTTNAAGYGMALLLSLAAALEVLLKRRKKSEK